ncbi:MAG TPA: site-2 protease family protein [Clostridia bacterium]|nr:site-2 protease family protein [Clostridia bacterium]
MRFFENALYRVPAVLIAMVLHECAHGYVAYRLGDPTAKMAGRLTLNPIRHLDPVGALMLFFLGFGWARPVPVNPRYFKRLHRDDFLVSIAGITTNLLIFLVCMLFGIWVNSLLWDPRVLQDNPIRELLGFNSDITAYILLGYGTELKEWFVRPELLPVLRLLLQIAMINLYIALFNLLPIPPLDGSHVVNDILFKQNLFVQRHVAQLGTAALLVLSFTGYLGKVLTFLATGVQNGLFGLLAWIGGL